jgi:CRP/FNR family transcriptional regulator, cyclic AMP receptor protein
MPDKYDQLLPALQKATIFAGLAEEGLKHIIDQCEVRTAKVGETVIYENTPATVIYVILKGRVKITLGQQDNSLEICEFDAGHCIGEASVIGISHHSASAIVVEDATLFVLSRKVLMNIFETDKEFFSYLILNIARELARRLHHTDEILLSYVRQNAKK